MRPGAQVFYESRCSEPEIHFVMTIDSARLIYSLLFFGLLLQSETHYVSMVRNLPSGVFRISFWASAGSGSEAGGALPFQVLAICNTRNPRIVRPGPGELGAGERGEG
jgi:hypothetical protein